MREEEDLSPVDRGAPRDDAVAEKLFFVQPERVGAMHHETVELHEGAVVNERLDPLAGGAFAALVLLRYRVGACRHLRLRTLALELFVFLRAALHAK